MHLFVLAINTVGKVFPLPQSTPTIIEVSEEINQKPSNNMLAIEYD